MVPWLHSFWLDEQGQDLIEYSLVVTFIVIACAALVYSGTPIVNGIWLKVNTQLIAANANASGN